MKEDIEFGKKYLASELCRVFGKDKLSGGYLTTFIKAVEKEYKLDKKGRWYTIERSLTEEEIQQKEKNITTKVSKHTKQELFNDYGIYMIKSLDNNDVYIGSTKSSFDERYKGHRRSSNVCTSKSIISGGHEFIILEKLIGCDEELIRRIENAYIQYYEYYTDYNVVNGRMAVGEAKNSIKYKSLRIDKEYIEEVKRILKEKGIQYE